jgi:predicted enzyme related to lactoylglutathione lyase
VSAPLPVGHLGVTGPDLDAAVRWYSLTFGWRLLMRPVDVSVEDERVADQIRGVFANERVAFRQAHLLAASDVAIELFEFHEPAATQGAGLFDYWNIGFFHICVVTRDIEALAARIGATGGRQRMTVREIFPGERFLFCYCEDPWGNIVELETHSHAESFGRRAGY